MTYGSISFNIQVFLTQLFKQLSDSTLESRLNLTNVEESQVFHLCCYMLDYLGKGYMIAAGLQMA